MIQILKIYILKSFQAKNKIRQILIFIDQIIQINKIPNNRKKLTNLQMRKFRFYKKEKITP